MAEPRRVTQSPDNALRWTWDRDPFGTTAVNANPSSLGTVTYSLRFPGQFYDASSELHYNYFRDYDPVLGRFLQTDPVRPNTLLHLMGGGTSIAVRYTRDALGRVTQSYAPYLQNQAHVGYQATTYDALSRPTIQALHTASGTLNRLTQRVYADQTVGYGYDAGTNGVGRLTSVTDASGSTSWSYTAQGRISGRTQVMGAMTKAVGYGYDAAGRLQSMTLPSGAVVAYGYTAGKVSSVTVNGTPVATGILYEPFGPTRGWTWGNSTIAVRSYTLDGNIAQVDSNGLKTHALDDAFRITGITDAVDPSRSWSYGYDLLDRLTTATRTGLTQGWTYDANGNRLTETGSTPSTFTVSPASNRVTAITGTLTRSLGYDAAGNTTADSVRTMTYNDAGRMTSYVKGGITTTLTYNALGQRVTKSNLSGTHYFVYDESGHLIGEYDGSGALFQETVYLGDIPIAALWPAAGGGITVTYVHTDHLNTPRSITRPSDNAVVWRWDSDALGTTLANEDPDGDGIPLRYYPRFPGQFYDASSEVHYNYFRDYDPAVGEVAPVSWTRV